MTADVIVIGSGFAGSVMARCMAETGKKVNIVERREHIAGNMYDFTDENGIRIQKYGPHVIHTNSDRVYRYISSFDKIVPYCTKCEVVVQGVCTPSPFNFRTIDQFYPKDKAESLKRKLTEYYGRDFAPVLDMLECDDPDIKGYARFLYDNDYSLYTAKQWNKKPEEIDPSVLRRVPVLFSYRDTYFTDKYEGTPEGGYVNLFEKITSHPNIEITLGTDALENITLDEKKGKAFYHGECKPIVFTGAIDELFGYIYGPLPYRSLYFECEYHKKKDYQSSAIVAHPSLDLPYTRITEYTKLPYQDVGNITVTAKEYPVKYDRRNKKGNEPYYPVLTKESGETYSKYKKYSEGFENLILCGRLADFKYYNMDQVIERTLDLFSEIKDKI